MDDNGLRGADEDRDVIAAARSRLLNLGSARAWEAATPEPRTPEPDDPAPRPSKATATPSPLVVSNLAPLVQSDSYGSITVGGQLPTATSFSVDGISTQLPRYGGPNKDLYPSVESFAEFRVNTVGNNAEFAQPTDITVITRGGSNDFHGAGYWYFQRQGMNSADQISGVVPSGDADTFGAVLSGPVTIPGLYKGKDKTFFYAVYEGLRQTWGQTSRRTRCREIVSTPSPTLLLRQVSQPAAESQPAT